MKVKLKKLPIDLTEEESTENLNEELYGSDEVSVQVKEANKLEFGFSFSAQDGESGNETEDFGDLPQELQKPGHIYNPSLSAGAIKKRHDPNEILDSMRIANEDDIGISYSEDSYTEPDDRKAE
jgi:hypothetical protein